MYRRIVFNKGLSLKEKIKRLGRYFLRRRGARILWKRKYKKVFKSVPQNNKVLDKQTESAHKEYWSAFRRNVIPATLRISSNFSGVADPKYIPEDVFQSDIEPTLNPTVTAEFFMQKSFYNHWFRGEVFPVDYFHNVDGVWLDPHLNPISYDAVREIANKLHYPVVMKPNRDSGGGKNVLFPENSEELVELAETHQNFLVQEKIVQHEFLNKYNAHGINSVRLNIYRSVKDNRLHVINHALRFGVGGSLDNLTSGGIGSGIGRDGILCGYATDAFGRKFLKHPDSGLPFDQKIPDFDDLKQVALQVASKVFYARIICLDLCYDAEGRWRMIEVNINSSTLKFGQYFGSQFFGQFTDEVRNYCIENHWAVSKAIS